MVLVLPQWNHRIPYCSRHGNQVTFTAKARFRSRPRGWLQAAVVVIVVAAALPAVLPEVPFDGHADFELYFVVLGPVLVAGLFAAWIAHNLIVKIIEAPDWGFCTACRRRRNGLSFAALACFLLMMLFGVMAPLFALAEPLGQEDVPIAMEIIRWVVIVAPGVLAIAGTALLAYARWAVIAGGVASRDGTAVKFRRPAPDFFQAMINAG
jgi:hypothetical protein